MKKMLPLSALCALALSLLFSCEKNLEPAPENLTPHTLLSDISLLSDSGFESGADGRMTTANSNWEVQRTGNNTTEFVVDRIENSSLSDDGSRHCLLSLPENANPAAFDHITIGQRLTLRPGIIYEASARVQWANPNNGNASAIVSFWAQHQADKTFAGKDVWIRNGAWTTITYRFMAVEPDQPIFVYLSLLPHQIPKKTDLRVDNFTLKEVENAVDNESRSGNLITDGQFNAQTVGGNPGGAWEFYSPNEALTGKVESNAGNKYVRLKIPANTNNFSAVKLMQQVTLTKGARYAASTDIKWNNYSGPGDSGIVNYIIYHEQSNTWWGPIDHVVEEGGWQTVPFTHGAPFDGTYQFFVQVFGWGNFGDAMDISFDNFSITPIGNGNDEDSETPTDPLQEGALIKIKNKATGKFLSPVNDEDFAKLVAIADDERAIWQVERTEDGHFRLKSQHGNRRIRPKNNTNGEPIMTGKTNWTGSWTHWKVVALENDSYRLINKVTDQFIRPGNPHEGEEVFTVSNNGNWEGDFTAWELIRVE